MTTNFVNLTPHDLKLNDGTVIPASGTVARVAANFSDFDQNGVCHQQFGDVQGLPAPQDGTLYVVSALVLTAVKDQRPDVVAPATGHPQCIRDNGMIVSVPGFVH